MEGMKTFIPSFITSLSIAAAVHAQNPQADGQVTLPYQQFLELTRKPETVEEIKPPLDALLSRADYTVKISDGNAVVSVDWLAENFTDTWAWVSVASLDLPVESDGESTFVASEEEIRLLMPKSGAHKASARFPAPSGLGIAARFPIIPATFNSVKIQSDDRSVDYQIDGATLLRDEKDELRYLLPATASEVVIRKSEVETGEKKPTTWSLSAATYLTYDAGWVDHEVHLHATPTSGDGMNMQLAFPHPPSRMQVSSENLLEHEKNEAGLLLRWDKREAGERSIVLQYRTQITGDDTHWSPKIPAVDGGSTVVLAVPKGAEIVGEEWIKNPNPSRLPTWLRDQAEEQNLVMLVGDLKQVEVKWLPRVETATMTIHDAMITTRVVADGSQHTTATYQISHVSSGSARWNLPEGMTLLDASVSGQRISPIDRDGGLEFDLPKPSGEKFTTVVFSYTGSGKPLDKVAGGMTLETPSCPLFAHSIHWSITLPDGTRLEAVESNAEIAPAPANTTAGSAWLKRMLSRGEPLKAELHYRSSNSEN
jgi:hypothetical protein